MNERTHPGRLLLPNGGKPNALDLDRLIEQRRAEERAKEAKARLADLRALRIQRGPNRRQRRARGRK